MNVSCKKAFTMVELVFVIVIIGILAAVAIPKLAATRDDAKISAEVRSAKQVIVNLASEYAGQGAFNNFTVADADAAVNCFTVTVSGTNGATIEPIGAAAATCSIVVLAGAITEAGKAGIINLDGSAKTYVFGGATVVK